MSLMDTINRVVAATYEVGCQSVARSTETIGDCVRYTPEMWDEGRAKAKACLAGRFSKYDAARNARLAKAKAKAKAKEAEQPKPTLSTLPTTNADTFAALGF